MQEIIQKYRGYTLRCVFDVSGYSGTDYEADFKELLRYQNTKEPDDELLSHKIKKPVSFNDFKQHGFSHFAEMVFNILKQNPSFITAKNFTVYVQVKRIPNREYYTGYENVDKRNLPDQMHLEISGLYLLNDIIMPMIHKPKYKDRVHESFSTYVTSLFFNHKDHITGNLIAEDKAFEFTKEITQRRESYNVKRLYEALNNLRDMGYPEFVLHIRNQKQIIDAEGIALFNQNLVKLTKMYTDKESTVFYEKNIGFNNSGPSGEIANGRYMCLTILLATAKKLRMDVTIYTRRLGMQKFSQITNFGEVLKSNLKIEVLDIPEKVMQAATQEVANASSDTFLRKYTDSCDQIGVPEELRVMTQARWPRLWTAVQDNSRQNRLDNKIKWFGK